VFERVDGEEKRRLSHYPPDWQSGSDDDVAALCERAEVVTRRLTPPLGSWKIGDTPVAPESPPAPRRSARTDDGDEQPRRR